MRNEALATKEVYDWADEDPEMAHLTPEQRALASLAPSREVWEAYYGIGEQKKKSGYQSERDFIEALRQGTVNRQDAERELRKWIGEERRQWSRHFAGEGPLDNMVRESGSELSLAQKIYNDFLQHAQDEEISIDAAGVLGWAMRLDKSRYLLAEALRQKDCFIEDDRYLFDKILPALYASPELEDFTVHDENLQGLIQNIVSSSSVRSKYGPVAEHGLNIEILIRENNPSLANNVQDTLRGWDWPRHIGEESADLGYISFIQLSEERSADSKELQQSALESSRQGLSHLVALRICAAVACTKERGQEKLALYLESGATEPDQSRILAMPDDKKILESLLDTRIFSFEQESRLRDAWEGRRKSLDHLELEEALEDSREMVFLGISDASKEYVSNFPKLHSIIHLPEILTEAICQRLQS